MRRLQIKFSDLGDGDYHAFYHKNPAAYEEDADIRLWLHRLLRKGDRVLDFGCGDGLVKRLIDELEIGPWIKYTGIDPDPDFKDPTGKGFEPDALLTTKEWLEIGDPYDVAVFAFSACDSGWQNVVEAVRRADRALVVFINREWPQNLRRLDVWLKYQLYYFPQARRLRWELRKEGLTIYRLCGREQYSVAVKR
jgi:SAM-dependent methyltransferase